VTAFLGTLRVLGPDLASARLFGDAKAALRQAGALVEDADLWIASIALAHRAVVVTGNRRHFDRIPGLQVEDWLR
jgi:tRNA(fMet)-specific endonuclease VapC